MTGRHSVKSLVRLLCSQLSPSIEDNMFLYETCLLHVGDPLYLGLDLIMSLQ